ncbi:unnamed protein product, partial [Rotaria magnacalcarata]
MTVTPSFSLCVDGYLGTEVCRRRTACRIGSNTFGVVGENISHLLRIAQRSPYFSGLYIELDLDYGRVLSLNKQLGSLLSRQLVILHLTAEKPNSSPGDLVRIIDKLGV